MSVGCGDLKIHRYLASLFGYELIKTRKLNDTLEQHLSNVIKQEQIDLVVDVGANEGQFARALRLHGYAGRIASFEPLSHEYKKLRELSGVDPQWFAFNLALGADDRHAEINTFAASEFSSLLPLNDYARKRFRWRTESTGTELVQVRRLSSVWADVARLMETPRVLLKLDTQGYDLEVLAGAREVLNRVQAIQAEVSLRSIYENAPRYLDALAEFERLGFEVTGMYPVSRDKSSLAIVEYDCVLTRCR
jgi:FkbM family methyltransferase